MTFAIVVFEKGKARLLEGGGFNTRKEAMSVKKRFIANSKKSIKFFVRKVS